MYFIYLYISNLFYFSSWVCDQLFAKFPLLSPIINIYITNSIYRTHIEYIYFIFLHYFTLSLIYLSIIFVPSSSWNSPLQNSQFASPFLEWLFNWLFVNHSLDVLHSQQTDACGACTCNRETTRRRRRRCRWRRREEQTEWRAITITKWGHSKQNWHFTPFHYLSSQTNQPTGPTSKQANQQQQ